MSDCRGRRLTILGIRGVPAAHGGFETFAERLCLWLRDRGWMVTVYCQEPSGGMAGTDFWEGIERIHVPAGDGARGTIEFDVKSTQMAQRQRGIFLTLGYNTGFLSAYLRLRGATNVINMDGIEWKRAKYSIAERAYLWVNEKIAAKSGDWLIADHPEIKRHLENSASPSKIQMIPYGADIIDDADATVLSRYGLRKKEYLTLIARPEPENSVLEIVRSFSKKRRNCNLVVLGKYDQTSEFQASVMKAASEEVKFIGPVYDRVSLAALRYFGLAYCHGHRVGGTNPSLVEALGAANPVIAHDNPFNRWVAGRAAAYFASEADLDNIWEGLIDRPDVTRLMSQEARSRCLSEFTWPKVLSSYEELLDRVYTEKLSAGSGRDA